MLDLNVRWLIRRDMPAVLGIEKYSFENPWTESDFLDCLKQRNAIGMVVVDRSGNDEVVVGYMIYELHDNWVEIINFAVANGVRRQGAGRTMTTKLVDRLIKSGRDRISIGVRETNLEAQKFFAAMGFRATDVIKTPYDDSDEDAYLMQYSLSAIAKEAAI